MNKICNKCNEEVSVSMFCKHKKSKDGLSGTCKNCAKLIAKKYNQDNKEKIQNSRKKYREENREKIAAAKRKCYDAKKDQYIEKAKKHYRENSEKAIERSRIKYLQSKDEILATEKINRKLNPEKYMWRNAKNRAKSLGLPFEITIEDIFIPEFCPILDIPLIIGTNTVHAGSPSLDRIIPELGYVKGNIQVISYKANTMKNNASFSELLMFSEWIQKLTNNLEKGD